MDELDFTKLTMRRAKDRADCWFVYCGDIHAGTISKATTVNGQSEWRWTAGFYPGSHPGEIKGGTAHSLESAKRDFLPAWLTFSRSRKPQDFAEWREQQRFAEKYRLRDAGQQVPIR